VLANNYVIDGIEPKSNPRAGENLINPVVLICHGAFILEAL